MVYSVLHVLQLEDQNMEQEEQHLKIHMKQLET